MKYDVTLKTLFQTLPEKLLWLLTGATDAKLETVELPSVKMRRPDLVYRLPDGSIHQFELQSDNDADMDYRMLEYYPHLCRLFGCPPKQWVIYLGAKPLKMKGRIVHPDLRYQYTVVDIEDFDAEVLLESDSIADNLLAVLCKNGTSPGTVRRILRRIAPLPVKQREDRFTQLLILSGLRKAEAVVFKEEKKMSLELNVMENSFLRGLYLEGEKKGEKKGEKLGVKRGVKLGEKRGEKRGKAAMLRAMLEYRFGKLPKWAAARLDAADNATLDRWAKKFSNAEKLEDVVPKPAANRAPSSR
jgi:hypothetical protein